MQVVELATAVVAGEEGGCGGCRTGRGVLISGAAFGEAARVGTERFQSFVAARHVARGIGRDAVFGTGTSVIAQALEGAAARTVLETDRVPVGVQALVAVHARARGEREEQGEARSGTQGRRWHRPPSAGARSRSSPPRPRGVGPRGCRRAASDA